MGFFAEINSQFGITHPHAFFRIMSWEVHHIPKIVKVHLGVYDKHNVDWEIHDPVDIITLKFNLSDFGDECISESIIQDLLMDSGSDFAGGEIIPEDAILGCTNPEACNYNEEANLDDGSCVYPTDPSIDYCHDECKDCNGDCYGEAYLDDCGVCSEGNTDHPANSDIDECGKCFGSGIPEDECDCEGNIDDCTGECGGETVVDCTGECGGEAEVDECGECNGPGAINIQYYNCEGDTAIIILEPELAEMVGYSFIYIDEDDVEMCYGRIDDLTCDEPTHDELEVVGGMENCAECLSILNGGVAGCMDPAACNYNSEATEDDGTCEYPEECSDCDGVCLEGECDDCAGTPCGPAWINECGDCVEEDDPLCVQGCDDVWKNDGTHLVNDCSGECGGGALVDDCGNCDGNEEYQEPDECGRCPGDEQYGEPCEEGEDLLITASVADSWGDGEEKIRLKHYVGDWSIDADTQNLILGEYTLPLGYPLVENEGGDEQNLVEPNTDDFISFSVQESEDDFIHCIFDECGEVSGTFIIPSATFEGEAPILIVTSTEIDPYWNEGTVNFTMPDGNEFCAGNDGNPNICENEVEEWLDFGFNHFYMLLNSTGEVLNVWSNDGTQFWEAE